MNASPLVSIIVPSFNVEQYIEKCLDSIKAQTYTNWECIIVDRPSTKDNTTKIVKAYIQGDSRFRFIEQGGKGVSDGRNVGFKASTGVYVQFTDPDDWLAPDLLQLSVERAEATDADIVQFGWRNYYIQTGRYEDTGFMPSAAKLPKIFSVADSGEEVLKYGEFYINSMSKLWRRDFLVTHNLHYPTDLKRAEDLAEVSRLVMHAKRMSYINKALYFYKIDEYIGDSLSNFGADDGHNLDFYKAIMIVHSNMMTMQLLPRFNKAFCQIAMSNALHALHMSKFNANANEEIYNCVKSKIFPMVASELLDMNPSLYETLKNDDYIGYLIKQLDQAYEERRQDSASALEQQNIQLRTQLATTQAELKSHLSIKRSAKLTLGNLKRRISPTRKGPF